MSREGAVLDNPVTGERIEFREPGGDAVAFDYYLRPGGFALGRLQHRHPGQSERVEVRPGRFRVRAADDEYRDEFAFGAVHLSLQRAAAAALAPLGRLVGYRARYPRYRRSASPERGTRGRDGPGP
jgi:hypothetical protein